MREDNRKISMCAQEQMTDEDLHADAGKQKVIAEQRVDITEIPNS
jgi:hypothetical protein